MRRTSSIVLFCVSLLLAGPVAAPAWGPMTHMAVNELAWEQAAAEMGSRLCVTPDLRDEFIGGGPCPDIKFTAGASFPIEFHNSPDVALRMIELARTGDRWGKADLAMALGWAGHIFGEVWTAHADDGYPSNKVTLPMPNGSGLNHQVNELVVDLLSYRDRARAQRKIGLAIPARLLEQAMADEAAREGKGNRLAAERIRAAGNGFMKTVSGIRVIAEYLLKERPDLLDEMDEFHTDRREDFDESVSRVTGLLREHGGPLSRAAKAGSADSKDNFFQVGATTSLKDQAKMVWQNWFGKVLNSDADTTVFTLIGYAAVKGSLSTPFLREKFLDVAREMGTASVWGDPRNKQVLARYVEAMLVREDLTYPEILAYAMEGIPPDPKALARRAEQLKAAGLTAAGRKPVTTAQVAEAWREVERLEALNREWPWFWPFRPGPQKAAAAREKAGRLLAFYFEDHPRSGVSAGRVAALLQADRALRSRLYEYKSVPWYNPFQLWQKRKDLTAASEAFLRQEREFAEIFQILNHLAAGGTTLERLTADTRQRLQQTEASLAAVKAQLARCPAWKLPTRHSLKQEIDRLEQGAAELRQRLGVLEGLAAPAAAEPAATTAAGGEPGLQAKVEPDVTVPDGMTLEQAQLAYEKAFSTYQHLAQAAGTDETRIREAAAAANQARRLRDAVQAKIEAGR
ncbi:MAG: hypothetical protein GX442_00075 [Candidatus Riflebacteria bacterium]|nr:hypothetical protein [Candidatus Riflebacteria bacterium]